MRKKLVRVGNSEALVITRELRALTGITGEVEVQVVGNTILLRPVTAPDLAASLERVLNENMDVLARLKDA